MLNGLRVFEAINIFASNWKLYTSDGYVGYCLLSRLQKNLVQIGRYNIDSANI